MEVVFSSVGTSSPGFQRNLPQCSNIKYNSVTTASDHCSQNTMTHLNISSDTFTDNSSSMPLFNCPTEIFSNTSSSSSRCLITTNKKTMFVRALFDYNPIMDSGLPSRGLPFQHGDILHVVNASDREWWQARQISLPSDFQTAISLNSSYLPDTTTTTNNNNTNDNNNNNNDSMSTQTPGLTTTTGLGIIPSIQRIERRQRTRLKRVNFVGKVTVIGSTTYPSALNSGQLCQSPWDIGENNPVTTGNSNEKNNNGITLPNTGIAGNTLRNNSLDINTKDHIPLMSITSETNNGQFDGNKKKRASSLTRNLLKCFTHRPVKNDSIGPMTVTRTGSLDGVNQKDRLPNIRSYDVVIPVKISMARPLILIGQLKDRVIDELLLQNSKFTTCILHTSRPQRPNEVNGVDYHFVTSKSIMEEDIKEGRYIEVNRFQDHYYATSLESVRSILQSGRICILDVEIDTAKYLEEIGLFPITILMKPRSLAHLRALQRRLTEDQAKRSMEQIERIEDEMAIPFSYYNI
ncbi:unnamed protein product [Heterobilharzia americana]|nr:unnamed protein product [Heterobilharzia americana]